MQMWQKIILGMVLGIITGFIFKEDATVLKPLGDIFIRMIKMLVVPLVFFSLVQGITSLQDIKTVERMGIKTFVIYLFTTMIAISIGLTVATIFQPGAGVPMHLETGAITAKESQSFIDTLLQIIPTNPIAAFAQGNILQVIFFAVLVGICLMKMGKKADQAVRLNDVLADMMFEMTNIVMKLAPIGVYGLMAWVIGDQYANVAPGESPMDMIMGFGKLIGCVVLATSIHVFFIYGGIIKFYLKLSVLQFFRGATNALSVAFSTSSSSATLPVTMEVAEENLGISKETASFVLPLGTTINMDGSALYQGVVVLFVAQALGVTLGFEQILTIVGLATISSIGTAGIPGAGIIMLTMILGHLGLPVEAIAVILGVDRLLDMLRTTVNVSGDLCVATLVDNTEGRFDKDIFDGKKEFSHD